MNSFTSVVVIPVLPRTKSFLFSKFSDLIIDNRYLDLRESKRLYGISGAIRILAVAKLKKYERNERFPDKEELEIFLPMVYSHYGFSNEDVRKLGRVFDQMCISELIIFCQNLASLPLMSRSNAIKLTLDFFGIPLDKYDYEAFRRLIDRYTPRAIGSDFFVYRSRLSSFIIKFYLEHLERYQDNPELLKSKIMNLKFNQNEFGKFDRPQ